MSKGTCDAPCSNSSYGRRVHTYIMHTRLFLPIAHNSDEWAAVCKLRTICERSIKREKEDYHLEDAKHCSIMMWTIRIYGIAMCQHIDAWYQENQLDQKSMLLSARG